MEEFCKEINLNDLSGPIMISWDVTNKCNFRCKHCYNSSSDSKIHNFKEELNFDQVKEVVKQIIEIRPYSFCICGGEPTLFPHLEYLVKELRKNGIYANMVSNGFLIDKTKAKWIKEIGIGLVQISIDGSKAATHDEFRCVNGAFNKALDALKNLKEVGAETAVSFCPNKKNLDEFFEMVQIVYDTGCRNLRMMPLLPMGRGLKNYNDLTLDNDGYLKLIKYIGDAKQKYEDMKIEWGDPIEHLYLANYVRDTPICVEIKANGDLGISNYLPITVGNVRKHTIKEYWEQGLKHIWSNPKAKHFCRQVLTTYDFAFLDLHTWNEDRYRFDLIDDMEGH